MIMSSCDHHVNNMVSNSSSRVGAVWRSNSPGTGGNGSWGRRSICLFPLLRSAWQLDFEKKCFSLQARGTVGRWGRQNVHETVARGRLHKKHVKNWGLRISPGFVCGRVCERCAKVGLFGVTLLCGLASGCDKTQWHGPVQQSVSDASTLLASGDCSWRLLMELCSFWTCEEPHRAKPSLSMAEHIPNIFKDPEKSWQLGVSFPFQCRSGLFVRCCGSQWVLRTGFKVGRSTSRTVDLLGKLTFYCVARSPTECCSNKHLRNLPFVSLCAGKEKGQAGLGCAECRRIPFYGAAGLRATALVPWGDNVQPGTAL